MKMQNFFLGIAEISLGMSFLISLMLLVLRLIGGKFTAKCRYILWTLVLIRLAVPFSFGILPALIEVPVEPVTEIRSEAQTTVMISTAEFTPSQIPQKTILQPQQHAQTPVTASAPELPVPSEQPPEVVWEQSLYLLSVIYLTVAVLFLCWNLLSYVICTGKILHAGKEPDEHTEYIYAAVCRAKQLRRIPHLLLSPHVNSPAAFGIFRRRIVLPDIEFTDNALTGTLLHEVTHCRRGDLYIKVTALFARSMHWFNPLVHLAVFRCEMEMELSCDEEVLAGCSDKTRAAYGEMMLDIILRCRQNRGTLTTHFNPKKNAVKVRLKNILYGSGKLRGRWLIAVCLILCLAAGTIVACRVEAENTEQTETAEDKTEETTKTLEAGSFWTYELSDTLSLSYNTDENGVYILSASDKNGERYPLTEVSLDILQFGSNKTLREVLPLSHRTTAEGYLFYFRYDIQFAYFYEITLIHKEDRLEYSSIRKIEQEEAEKLGVFSTEMVTVTSLEELADYRDNYVISENVYDFYYNLLSGESEIPEYNTVRIEDFSIRFTVPMTEYSTYFSFTVTESGLETLPEGNYEWQVLDIVEVVADNERYDNSRYLEIPEVQKLFRYLSYSFIYNTPAYGQGITYPGVYNYILGSYHQYGRLPQEDFYRIAGEEFGITDFALLELEESIREDGTFEEGSSGGSWFGEVLSITEDETTVVITMQYYADNNCLLKSHRISYTFGKDGRWLGHKILERAKYEPYHLRYVEDRLPVENANILTESVFYSEENTFADFDLLGETTGSASEHLRSDIKDTSDKIPESNLEKFIVLLNMTYEEIRTAGIIMTLSHYESGGSPVYEISGLDEVSVVFPAATDNTSSANTEAELMAEYPVKILIHGVNIEILPGVKVGMDAETVSASGMEWDEVYMSSENSLYYTTHAEDSFCLTAAWAIPEELFIEWADSLSDDADYYAEFQKLIEPFRETPVGKIVEISIERI